MSSQQSHIAQFVKKKSDTTPTVLIPGDGTTNFFNTVGVITGVGTIAITGPEGWGIHYTEFISLSAGQNGILKFRWSQKDGHGKIGFKASGTGAISHNSFKVDVQNAGPNSFLFIKDSDNVDNPTSLVFMRTQGGSVTTTKLMELERLDGDWILREDGIVLHTIIGGYNGAGNFAVTYHSRTAHKDISVTK